MNAAIKAYFLVDATMFDMLPASAKEAAFAATASDRIAVLCTLF